MKYRIKQIREQLGFSRKKFAEEIGVKRSALSNYESNFRTPRDPIEFGYKILDLAKSKGFNFYLEDIYPREL